jgi:prepilin-type N-terminal cleavage/methylation domain-containing protein
MNWILGVSAFMAALAVFGVLYFGWMLVRINSKPAPRQYAGGRTGYVSNQAGFSLLELMICCLIVTILASIVAPSPVAVKRMMDGRGARNRVQAVRDANLALAICNANKVSCPGVAPIIPADGTVTVAGTYTYSYSTNGAWWTFSAWPAVPAGNRSYYADSTGILRYSDTTVADWASPQLQ